ncbi:MAG: alkaline phosphatase family protein [Austwickia sp.]|nr:alkaline phosphatase family protein [Austwickia sp.]
MTTPDPGRPSPLHSAALHASSALGGHGSGSSHSAALHASSTLRYDGGGLASVLPRAAASIGVPLLPGTTHEVAAEQATFPAARQAVVVLIDGLGYELLSARAGHAPYLRTLLATGTSLRCGFPSTTATSMGTFGTGLPPGAHGLVGYEVLDPDRDVIFNELSWEDGPHPETWQPHPTVFEAAAADGVHVTRVGPWFFDGSGLTRSALRGGTFVAAKTLPERVEATLTALRAARRSLVYLYWGDLDKIGHVHGCGSWQWLEELEAVDAQLRRLAAALPPHAALYVTADHGMIDCPFEDRLDLATEPELVAGTRHIAGEARARMIYCRPGATQDVAAAWTSRLAGTGHVVTRDQAIAAGWYGAPSDIRDAVRERIGDLIVVMTGPGAVVDSRRDRPELLALLGLHGSVTDVETAIPLLTQPPERS